VEKAGRGYPCPGMIEQNTYPQEQRSVFDDQEESCSFMNQYFGFPCYFSRFTYRFPHQHFPVSRAEQK
jgi:hypothetical protein